MIAEGSDVFTTSCRAIAGALRCDYSHCIECNARVWRPQRNTRKRRTRPLIFCPSLRRNSRTIEIEKRTESYQRKTPILANRLSLIGRGGFADTACQQSHTPRTWMATRPDRRADLPTAARHGCAASDKWPDLGQRRRSFARRFFWVACLAPKRAFLYRSCLLSTHELAIHSRTATRSGMHGAHVFEVPRGHKSRKPQGLSPGLP